MNDPDHSHEIIGRRLRHWRRCRRLNQTQVAAMLHTSRYTVAHIEDGKRKLTFLEVLLLYQRANMPMTALMMDDH